MYKLFRTMGCVKSKKRDPNANSTEKGRGGEKAYLVPSGQQSQDGRPPVSPALLDFAQRLSEEIVSRAVQQWVEVDRRYVDIPYIECDVP
ncbi:small membrane A-kinase anchor protein-like [Periophthalmus magnuspinnatus]|uniref:small membrane A-kinase anchor protein-like n=1 Tax=Periophthalmus magnuspinnatus TaxID=409849 RepID=UPI002436ADB0|nr:small membrane A-kinase anchor protein-like [Periophthalmus magnuspinnatus]